MLHKAKQRAQHIENGKRDADFGDGAKVDLAAKPLREQRCDLPDLVRPENG